MVIETTDQLDICGFAVGDSEIAFKVPPSSIINRFFNFPLNVASQRMIMKLDNAGECGYRNVGEIVLWLLSLKHLWYEYGLFILK